MRPTSYIKKWPAKHLSELVAFLEKQHDDNLSIKDVANRTGMTIQYISFLFRKDDMKLSRAENIAKAYGYTLKLYFPQREWKYEGPNRREFPNAKNLSGLVQYMNDSNKTVNSLSQELRISNGVLTKAFNNGDIFISMLYTVVEMLNIEFIWSFEKI